MSRLQVSGNASGTGVITLAAPNTNSTVTLNLPNVNGTLNSSGLVNEVPVGSAAAPSIYSTGDTNTGLFFPAADTIAFSEGGVEAMRINSSGNVGIGTASANASLHVAGLLEGFPTGNGVSLGSGSGGYGRITLIGPSGGFIDFSTPGVNFKGRIICANSDNAMAFYTEATERMRITSTGDVAVGTTAALSSAKFSVKGHIASNGYSSRSGTGGAFSGNIFNIYWTGSDAQLWIDTTNVGTISFTSDYRIKRNIQTQTIPALERVMQLRPVTYQMADYGTLFKQNENIKEGFIAHEVQAVIPSGVDGAKDDKTKIQSLRLDAMLAVAIKAIQELTVRLEALENK